jgi:hypothetical protein
MTEEVILTETSPVAADTQLEDDRPLTGNPILTRAPGAPRGGTNAIVYVGLPVAVLAICAGAYWFVTTTHRQSPLMTDIPAPPPQAIAAAAAMPSVPAAAPATVEQRLSGSEHHRSGRIRMTASPAGGEGVDAAATVRESSAAPPSAPPMITPPPAQ